MKPVLPARTSTSSRPSSRFVLRNVIVRGFALVVRRVYSDMRMIDAMRSSFDAWVMRRAMSKADDTLSDKRPDVSA
jgi:hypothetical protein